LVEFAPEEGSRLLEMECAGCSAAPCVCNIAHVQERKSEVVMEESTFCSHDSAMFLSNVLLPVWQMMLRMLKENQKKVEEVVLEKVMDTISQLRHCTGLQPLPFI
jgi:hypothetical protein